MVFPLVFCIFPAIWVVTIGPAAIKFVQVLVPDGAEHKKHDADRTADRHRSRRRRSASRAGAAGADDARGHRPRPRSARAAARQDAVRRRGDRPRRSPSGCGCRTRMLEPLIEHAARRAADRSARRHRIGHGRLPLRAHRPRAASARGSISTSTTTSGRRRCRSQQYVAADERAAGAARGYIDRERLRDGLLAPRSSATQMLEQLGPAVNAGKAVFLYGPPGNGKTVIAEGIGRALGGDMYMPHAHRRRRPDHHDVRPDQPRARSTTDADAGERHRGRAARSPLGAHPPAGRDGRRRAHARDARPDASTRSRSSTKRRSS